MDEDRKKDVSSQEEVLDPETSNEAEVIEKLEELCNNCYSNPIAAKRLCTMCRLAKYQETGRW